MKDMVILFWWTLFAHFVADYTLQGWLAQGKQESWWRSALGGKIDGTIYRNDYKMALWCHSLYWSLAVMLPARLLGFEVGPLAFTAIVVANSAAHYAVDDLKANKLKINLWEDQLAHLAQLVATAAAVAFLG